MIVEWSPDPKSARTCAPSVFPKLPHSPKYKRKSTADLAGPKMLFQYISFQCSLRTPIMWMGSSEFNGKKYGWERLGNILWGLFKVQRFLTCRGSECARIASDLLIISSFRMILRQCFLGACWNWWKAKVSPARKAGNLELDLGKSSSASQAAVFSDSLP